MKKLATLLLAAGLIFGAAHPSQGVEVKASGMFDFAFEYTSGLGGNNNGYYTFMNTKDARAIGSPYDQKHTTAVQRLMIGMQFIMSENLSAYWDGMFGYFTWGGPATGITYPQNQNGGALGTRSANIITRQAYLDWMIPRTEVKIRMGYQFFFMPTFAAGNCALVTETGSGITVSAPVNDHATAMAEWIRVNSGARRGAPAILPDGTDDTLDVFALILPLKFEGWRAAPWLGVARAGKGAMNYANSPVGDGLTNVSGTMLPLAAGVAEALGNRATGATIPEKANSRLKTTTAWWAGLGGELTMFDPFKFGLDAYYGDNGENGFYKRAGWYVSGKASYKTKWGLPTLVAWYATGDDGNIRNGSERPTLLHGGFYGQGADTFFTTSIGTIEKTLENGIPAGTWGASLQWNTFSVVDGLFHNLHVTYFQGTNNQHMARYANPVQIQTYLTEKDSAVEVDLNSTYSIYKNLAAMLQLSYVFQNFDDDLWTRAARTAGSIDADKRIRFSNAYRVSLMMRYTF